MLGLPGPLLAVLAGLALALGGAGLYITHLLRESGRADQAIADLQGVAEANARATRRIADARDLADVTLANWRRLDERAQNRTEAARRAVEEAVDHDDETRAWGAGPVHPTVAAGLLADQSGDAAGGGDDLAAGRPDGAARGAGVPVRP